MKILRSIGLIILVIVSVFMGIVLFWRTEVPEGRPGTAAENMADSLAAAMGQEAWDQLKWLSWAVNGKRAYTWNKDEGLAIIRYGDYRVHLNLQSQIGSVWKKGEIVEGVKKDQVILKAWKKWCFDSFMLNPVARIRDKGTVRKYVEGSDGARGLLVTFAQGGISPGDSYLFELNDRWLPRKAGMWARRIPLGGINMTFEDYTRTDEGIRIANRHRIGPVNLSIDNLATGDSFKDLGFDQDPFLFIE